MPRGVAFRGFLADPRSVEMIEEAERLGGPLRLTQGAYSTSVRQSAGTHNGGGVFDFSVRGLTNTQINRRVKALRRVGFFASHRLTSEGPWPAHIHAVAIGCPDLAPLADIQVEAYRDGYSGLGRNGRGSLDRHRGLGVPFTTWEQYLRERDREEPVVLRAVVKKARQEDRYVGRVAKALRAEGFTADPFGYSRWQRKLGYRGGDADGIAGYDSLRKLGRKYGWKVET